MPFGAVEYPSLALGILKNASRKAGFRCDVAYLNILFAEMIGLEAYNFIVATPGHLLGERVFAGSLYPDRIPTDGEYFASLSQPIPPDAVAKYRTIKRYVEPFLSRCMSEIPFNSYDIIGFSSLFEQNLASLALAARIKKAYPHIAVIFGGPNWEDCMGRTLHRCFPFVDYSCSGESDKTFPELLNRLRYHHPLHDLPGIVYRDNGVSVFTGPAAAMENLDSSPIPDYDDYFARLRQSPFAGVFKPHLMWETSRGCWWGQSSKCTFCGLNGCQILYRHKSEERILDEFQALRSRYGAETFRAADNALSPGYFKRLIPELAKIKGNCRFIFEVRANLDERQTALLSSAGITVIQIGVENLCSRVLKLMHKGTSSLANVQALKLCEQYSVHADWNIIFGFPGEKPSDYAGNLEMAKLLSHLNPPTGYGPIRLDRFSFNYEHADELGLTRIRPFAPYRFVYPFDERTLMELCPHFEYDLAEKIDDAGLERTLFDAVMSWKSRKAELYGRREADSLAIYDTRGIAGSTKTILKGIEKEIYEFCNEARSLDSVLDRFSGAPDGRVNGETAKTILESFVKKNLMIREDDRFIGLAVLPPRMELVAR